MQPGAASLTSRRVLPEDAGVLSVLAFQSKSHWGYGRSFMAQARAELTWTAADLASHLLAGEMLEDREHCAGFYLLDSSCRAEPELDAMFVSPDWIGHGAGKRLMQMAVKAACSGGAGALRIVSDPNAEGFYRAMGAKLIGERPSGSIPGRSLPLLRMAL